MPTPGSRAYDRERSRLRKDLENRGVPHEQAEARAKQLLAERMPNRSPGAAGERAAGPLGGRGGGDPGDVIQLRSPAFSDGAPLPPRHTVSGEGRSPALHWGAPPPDTVELALVCEDLDGFDGPLEHWLVTGIDPGISSLDEGASPPGDVWPNAFGDRGFSPPAPPVGDEPHRYVFRLFALGRRLELDPASSLDDVREALDSAAIATGTLIGVFVR